MKPKGVLVNISQPTPELPVPNVQAAQDYYRDVLGFDVAWYNEAGKIGAVARGECALFFREADGNAAPSTFWVHCEDLDEAHAEFQQRGANITEPPLVKSWGLRQFTIQDHCANTFYFFQDS